MYHALDHQRHFARLSKSPLEQRTLRPAIQRALAINSDGIAALVGRRLCLGHSRSICRDHVRAPPLLVMMRALLVKRENFATAARQERQNQNDAEYYSDEEPSSHGDLHT
jgi:hypothetical protein